MSAFLPPSSSVNALSVAAAPAITALPAGTLPMKPIFATFGCATRATPASRPPVTTLNTPGGNTSCHSSAILSDDSGGLVRGFDHERIAGGERRAAFTGGEQQRMVECADSPDDAERLAQRVVERARTDRNGVALDLGDQPGEIFHVPDADLDVVAHGLEWIAGIERLEPGELVRVREQDRRRGADRFRPLLGRTSRHVRNAFRAAATARSTSSAVASTTVPSASPVAGAVT
jgi:hypothetical protein